MLLFDYILLGALLLFVFYGFRAGLIQSVGALIGLIVGSVFASRYCESIGNLLGDSNFMKMLAFFLLFGLITKLIGFVFKIVGKIFKIITVLPLLAQADKLLGAIFGAAEGILFLAVMLFFLSKFPINAWLTNSMSASVITATLLKISAIFMPLFPVAVKQLETLIKK
ncbi:CvpA family protein [Candidatus Falkowbacteria bacterium]|nr:CvpA family protein [Candidatus Falkowbacteria bacterium]